MKKYFDAKGNRLVFIEQEASPSYWDNQWDVTNLKETIKNGTKNRLITKTTLKFIAPDKSKKILDGGCGNGQFVYAFHKLGYDAYGVDYAPKTVAKVKELFPELQVLIGDVKRMGFADNSLDGYWSIGVIEHFFDGYGEILKEMERVIKPGGFLFLTFPYMSFLRRFKAWLGFYPYFQQDNIDLKHFYQFALNHNTVIQDLKQHNFNLVQTIPYAGTKGLKDEIALVKPILQKLYDSQNMFLRLINYGLSFLSSRFSGHSILLVFRKK